VVVPPPPPAVKVPVVVEVFHGARKTDVNFKDKPEQENPEAKQ
jgi:hypothetical protein